MITIERLAKIFEQNFVPPFLPEGLVKVRLLMGDDKKPYLEITIGPRDVEINEDGRVIGSGTDVSGGGCSDA